MVDNFILETNLPIDFNWAEYFKENKNNLLYLPYEEEDPLSCDEVNLITKSIQAFQLGEGSDGRILKKMVEEYTNKSKRYDFNQIMAYFIAEENRHSQSLAKFMKFHNIPCKRNNLLDYFFRRLRKIAGLEFSIIVLVTAEMIALSYYTVLSKATSSKVLKVLCSQMLRDELMHVSLQSDTLNHFFKTNGKLKNIFIMHIRTIIMFITLIFVWIYFKKIFNAGEYNFLKLINISMNVLKQSNEIVKADIKSK